MALGLMRDEMVRRRKSTVRDSGSGEKTAVLLVNLKMMVLQLL